MKSIQNLGFSCRLETINAVEAGAAVSRRRISQRSPRPASHAEPGGPASDHVGLGRSSRESIAADAEEQSAAPFGATTGATPFRVNLHVSDLGHTLMCGPSGAGKSTALGLIAAQWFRYPRAQVFAFDKGYSLFVLTKAAEGEFYDLAGEKTDLAFCPIARNRFRCGSHLGGHLDRRSMHAQRTRRYSEAPECAHSGPRSCAFRRPEHSQNSAPTFRTSMCGRLCRFYTLSGRSGHLLDAEEDLLGEAGS